MEEQEEVDGEKDGDDEGVDEHDHDALADLLLN